METLLASRPSPWVNTILRVAVGAVMLAHGLQKVGVLGGGSLSKTLAFFTGVLHVPLPLAVLVVLAETAGAVMLLAGAFTRVAAFGVAATMLGAIAIVHAPNGFFMNWFGAAAGEGYEFHLLVLAMVGPLLALGGGAWSVDARLLEALQSRSSKSVAPASFMGVERSHSSSP